jgi:hypothetical protein
MKDSPEQHIIIKGRPYRYDADFDAYYRIHEPERPVSKYAWIVLCIVLAIVCYAIEHAGI